MQKWRDQLPPQVVGRAQALGALGIAWLTELDSLVARLEEVWRIQVNSVLQGGSHAFIGQAEDTSGSTCILKIELPDYSEADFLKGVGMLERAAGNGYCRVFAVDALRRAVLLEQLGEPLRLSGKSIEEQMQVLCRALVATWQIPLVQEERKRNDGNYVWFRSFIPGEWEAAGKPCARGVVDESLRILDWLEAQTNPEEYVWIHGDAHSNNMLRVPGTDDYKFIDPDGKVFEKSYDVGVLMREWPEAYVQDPVIAGHERSRLLSVLTGVPEAEIWAWGYLQMVATALILRQIGQNELSETMLRIAEAWT